MAFWSQIKSSDPPAPAAVMDAATLKGELGHAYRRGRSDERARHPGRAMVAAGVILLAAVGAGFLALGARDGSFAAAGAGIDHAAAQAVAALGGRP